MEYVQAAERSRPWQLLLLSAETGSDLESATDRLVEQLKQHPDQNLADVAYTYQLEPANFSHRRMVVCHDLEDAIEALEKRGPTRVSTARQGASDRPVAFMFPGLGDHYVNMGLGLYQTEATFREQVDLCAELIKPHLGLDLREVLYPNQPQAEEGCQKSNHTLSTARPSLNLRKMLYPDEEQADEAAKKLNQTSLTQPALFVIEYALARLWMEWGIRPWAMIGYSIGEYVAACMAGVFSLRDVLFLVAKRAQLIQALPGGAMLAVPLAEKDLDPLLGQELSLAAANGPSLSVISGPTDAVAELERQLTERGLACRRLQTSHAFHSTMMSPISEPFTEMVRSVSLKPPQIPYISNVTGTWASAEQATDPSYWAEHMCQTVRFADGVCQVWKEPGQILLEVGPGQTLGTLAMQHPESAHAKERVVLSSIRHLYDKQPDMAFLLRTLGELWLTGIPVDWSGFYARERRHRVPLPSNRYTEGLKEISSPPCAARSNLTNPYVAPSNEIEQRVADIWQKLLGTKQPGVHDNFFKLGGQSLQGAQLIYRLCHAFKVDLPVQTIFEAPTVAGLASVIEEMLITEIEELSEDERLRSAQS
jgi:acyl transferase domain-containing protein